MRKIFAIFFLFLGLESMASEHVFDFDKGNLDILWGEFHAKYRLETNFASNCSGSDVSVVEVRETVVVRHTGNYCPSGAKFRLILNPQQITKTLVIRFGHGVVYVGSLIKDFRNVKAFVRYGMIDTKGKHHVTSQYIGAELSANHPKAGKYFFEIRLESGVIHF